MIVKALQIPLEEVQDPTHKLLGILQTMGPGKVARPINRVLLELAPAVWHTAVNCAPTPKKTEKRYFCLI